MIKQYPCCLLYIICFSCVIAQYTSPIQSYDSRCTSSYTTQYENQVQVPHSLPYVCLEKDPTLQICSCRHNLQNTKVISLAGYDEQIYQIIRDVRKNTYKNDVLVIFYIYQNDRLYFLDSLMTSADIFEMALTKYHHYFCLDEGNIHRFNNAGNSWCVNNVIVIPSHKESLMLKDLASQHGDEILNKYVDHIHTNENVNRNYGNNILTRVPYQNNYKDQRFGWVKDDATIPKCYEFNIPGPRKMVVPPLIAFLKCKDEKFPTGDPNKYVFDVRNFKDEAVQMCPNWYTLKRYNNVLKGPVICASFSSNVGSTTTDVYHSSIDNDGNSGNFKICSTGTSSSSQITTQRIPTYFSLSSPINYYVPPSTCNVFKTSSNENAIPCVNYNTNALENVNNDFIDTVNVQPTVYRTSDQYDSKKFVNYIPDTNIFDNSKNCQGKTTESNAKCYFFNGARQNYMIPNSKLVSPYNYNVFNTKSQFSTRPPTLPANINTYKTRTDPDIASTFYKVKENNNQYESKSTLLTDTQTNLNLCDSALSQAVPLDNHFLCKQYPKVSQYWPNYYVNFKPENYKAEDLNIELNIENNHLSKIQTPDLQLSPNNLPHNQYPQDNNRWPIYYMNSKPDCYKGLNSYVAVNGRNKYSSKVESSNLEVSSKEISTGFNEICPKKLESNIVKEHKTVQAPEIDFKSSILPSYGYNEPYDWYTKYFRQNSDSSYNENYLNPETNNKKIYEFTSPRQAYAAKDLQLSVNIQPNLYTADMLSQSGTNEYINDQSHLNNQNSFPSQNYNGPAIATSVYTKLSKYNQYYSPPPVILPEDKNSPLYLHQNEYIPKQDQICQGLTTLAQFGQPLSQLKENTPEFSNKPKYIQNDYNLYPNYVQNYFSTAVPTAPIVQLTKNKNIHKSFPNVQPQIWTSTQYQPQIPKTRKPQNYVTLETYHNPDKPATIWTPLVQPNNYGYTENILDYYKPYKEIELYPSKDQKYYSNPNFTTSPIDLSNKHKNINRSPFAPCVHYESFPSTTTPYVQSNAAISKAFTPQQYFVKKHLNLRLNYNGPLRYEFPKTNNYINYFGNYPSTYSFLDLPASNDYKPVTPSADFFPTHVNLKHNIVSYPTQSTAQVYPSQLDNSAKIQILDDNNNNYDLSNVQTPISESDSYSQIKSPSTDFITLQPHLSSNYQSNFLKTNIENPQICSKTPIESLNVEPLESLLEENTLEPPKITSYSAKQGSELSYANTIKLKPFYSQYYMNPMTSQEAGEYTKNMDPTNNYTPFKSNNIVSIPLNPLNNINTEYTYPPLVTTKHFKSDGIYPSNAAITPTKLVPEYSYVYCPKIAKTSDPSPHIASASNELVFSPIEARPVVDNLQQITPLNPNFWNGQNNIETTPYKQTIGNYLPLNHLKDQPSHTKLYAPVLIEQPQNEFSENTLNLPSDKYVTKHPFDPNSDISQGNFRNNWSEKPIEETTPINPNNFWNRQKNSEFVNFANTNNINHINNKYIQDYYGDIPLYAKSNPFDDLARKKQPTSQFSEHTFNSPSNIFVAETPLTPCNDISSQEDTKSNFYSFKYKPYQWTGKPVKIDAKLLLRGDQTANRGNTVNIAPNTSKPSPYIYNAKPFESLAQRPCYNNGYRPKEYKSLTNIISPIPTTPYNMDINSNNVYNPSSTHHIYPYEDFPYMNQPDNPVSNLDTPLTEPSKADTISHTFYEPQKLTSPMQLPYYSYKNEAITPKTTPNDPTNPLYTPQVQSYQDYPDLYQLDSPIPFTKPSGTDMHSPIHFDSQIPYSPVQTLYQNAYNNKVFKTTPETISNAPYVGSNLNIIMPSWTHNPKAYNKFPNFIPLKESSLATASLPTSYSFQIPSYTPKQRPYHNNKPLQDSNNVMPVSIQPHIDKDSIDWFDPNSQPNQDVPDINSPLSNVNPHIFDPKNLYSPNQIPYQINHSNKAFEPKTVIVPYEPHVDPHMYASASPSYDNFFNISCDHFSDIILPSESSVPTFPSQTSYSFQIPSYKQNQRPYYNAELFKASSNIMASKLITSYKGTSSNVLNPSYTPQIVKYQDFPAMNQLYSTTPGVNLPLVEPTILKTSLPIPIVTQRNSPPKVGPNWYSYTTQTQPYNDYADMKQLYSTQWNLNTPVFEPPKHNIPLSNFKALQSLQIQNPYQNVDCNVLKPAPNTIPSEDYVDSSEETLARPSFVPEIKSFNKLPDHSPVEFASTATLPLPKFYSSTTPSYAPQTQHYTAPNYIQRHYTSFQSNFQPLESTMPLSTSKYPQNLFGFSPKPQSNQYVHLFQSHVSESSPIFENLKPYEPFLRPSTDPLLSSYKFIHPKQTSTLNLDLTEPDNFLDNSNNYSIKPYQSVWSFSYPYIPQNPYTVPKFASFNLMKPEISTTNKPNVQYPPISTSKFQLDPYTSDIPIPKNIQHSLFAFQPPYSPQPPKYIPQPSPYICQPYSQDPLVFSPQVQPYSDVDKSYAYPHISTLDSTQHNSANDQPYKTLYTPHAPSYVSPVFTSQIQTLDYTSSNMLGPKNIPHSLFTQQPSETSYKLQTLSHAHYLPTYTPQSPYSDIHKSVFSKIPGPFTVQPYKTSYPQPPSRTLEKSSHILPVINAQLQQHSNFDKSYTSDMLFPQTTQINTFTIQPPLYSYEPSPYTSEPSSCTSQPYSYTSQPASSTYQPYSYIPPVLTPQIQPYSDLDNSYLTHPCLFTTHKDLYSPQPSLYTQLPSYSPPVYTPQLQSYSNLVDKSSTSLDNLSPGSSPSFTPQTYDSSYSPQQYSYTPQPFSYISPITSPVTPQHQWHSDLNKSYTYSDIPSPKTKETRLFIPQSYETLYKQQLPSSTQTPSCFSKPWPVLQDSPPDSQRENRDPEILKPNAPTDHYYYSSYTISHTSYLQHVPEIIRQNNANIKPPGNDMPRQYTFNLKYSPRLTWPSKTHVESPIASRPLINSFSLKSSTFTTIPEVKSSNTANPKVPIRKWPQSYSLGPNYPQSYKEYSNFDHSTPEFANQPLDTITTALPYLSPYSSTNVEPKATGHFTPPYTIPKPTTLIDPNLSSLNFVKPQLPVPTYSHLPAFSPKYPLYTGENNQLNPYDSPQSYSSSVYNPNLSESLSNTWPNCFPNTPQIPLLYRPQVKANTAYKYFLKTGSYPDFSSAIIQPEIAETRPYSASYTLQTTNSQPGTDISEFDRYYKTPVYYYQNTGVESSPITTLKSPKNSCINVPQSPFIFDYTKYKAYPAPTTMNVSYKDTDQKPYFQYPINLGGKNLEKNDIEKYPCHSLIMNYPSNSLTLEPTSTSTTNNEFNSQNQATTPVFANKRYPEECPSNDTGPINYIPLPPQNQVNNYEYITSQVLANPVPIKSVINPKISDSGLPNHIYKHKLETTKYLAKPTYVESGLDIASSYQPSGKYLQKYIPSPKYFNWQSVPKINQPFRTPYACDVTNQASPLQTKNLNNVKGNLASDNSFQTVKLNDYSNQYYQPETPYIEWNTIKTCPKNSYNIPLECNKMTSRPGLMNSQTPNTQFTPTTSYQYKETPNILQYTPKSGTNSPVDWYKRLFYKPNLYKATSNSGINTPYQTQIFLQIHPQNDRNEVKVSVNRNAPVFGVFSNHESEVNNAKNGYEQHINANVNPSNTEPYSYTQQHNDVFPNQDRFTQKWPSLSQIVSPETVQPKTEFSDQIINPPTETPQQFTTYETLPHPSTYNSGEITPTASSFIKKTISNSISNPCNVNQRYNYNTYQPYLTETTNTKTVYPSPAQSMFNTQNKITPFPDKYYDIPMTQTHSENLNVQPNSNINHDNNNINRLWPGIYRLSSEHNYRIASTYYPQATVTYFNKQNPNYKKAWPDISKLSIENNIPAASTYNTEATISNINRPNSGEINYSQNTISYNYPASPTKPGPLSKQQKDTNHKSFYPCLNCVSNYNYLCPRSTCFETPNGLTTEHSRQEICYQAPEASNKYSYNTETSNSYLISSSPAQYSPKYLTKSDVANIRAYPTLYPSRSIFSKGNILFTPASHNVLNSPTCKSPDLTNFAFASQPPLNTAYSTNSIEGNSNLYYSNYRVQSSPSTVWAHPNNWHNYNNFNLCKSISNYYKTFTPVNGNVVPSTLNQYRPVINNNVCPINIVNAKRFAIHSLLKTNPYNKIYNSNQISEKLLSDKEKTISLGNVCLVKYPSNCQQTSLLKTNDPRIYMKTWKSKMKVITAKIVLDESEYDVTNFMPVVRDPDISDFEAVQNVVKDMVTPKYGEPIVLKGVFKIYNPYAVVCNIDDAKFHLGANTVLWPTFDENMIPNVRNTF